MRVEESHASAGTQLDRLINIITDPDEPNDTRDAFFVSYRNLKHNSLSVIEALVCLLTCG